MGLALGAVLWAVLAALTVAQGFARDLFTMQMLGAHVRLLLVIPLFFLCETLVDPRMGTFAGMIARSGIVPKRMAPALESEIARSGRYRDSWVAEAGCLLAAVILSVIGWSRLSPPGGAMGLGPDREAAGATLAGLWYGVVCLPFFRFLMFRWLWRLGLWSWFLWRVARLDLDLVPTHSDGAAGLGYLEVVHEHFTPLALAVSLVQAASLAGELSSGTIAFERIYPSLALVLVVNAALFLGPMIIFVPRLWSCRVRGLNEYMEFASTYVHGFDRKWLRTDAAGGESPLGTADLQSLADLTNSLDVVRGMRLIPAGARLLGEFVVATALPLLPLCMFKYPVAALTEMFFKRLTGL